MTLLRCPCCQGSGRVMGGGMLMKDCENCNGIGKKDDGIVKVEDIKESNAYRDAIDKIKALDKNMSEEDAQKIFAEQFNKLEEVKIIKKRGRPKK